MANVKSTLRLEDRMSSTLTSITRAMNSTLVMMRNIKGQNVGGDFAKAAQDIKRAEAEVNNFNSSLNKASSDINNNTNALDNMTNSVISLVSAYASFQGIKKVINLSDEYTQTTARLDLMNDGLQTTSQLQDKIFASAQRSRAEYGAVASAVAKLGLTAGKAFKSNDEIIAFTELLNKNFVVGGAGATEQAAAMYQLTQAMGSGKLQGDEYRSIIENAPLLARAIEDYMRNVQKAKGTMKEWAADGLLTADVIKAALFSSADQINAKFESMPMTWSQVWTAVMNRLYKLSMPLLNIVNKLAQHWDVLEPIVLGVVGALGLYIGALVTLNIIKGITNTLELISAARSAMSAGKTLMQAAATTTATGAQVGLNAALLACPITWIILAIIAIIAAIYAVVAAINKVKGTSVSATGIIVGALATAAAFVWNLFLGVLDLVLGVINYMYNGWATFANFFANIFNDPIASIIKLFGGLADNVLGILQTIASAIDKIFGSNLAGAVSGWRNSVSSKVDSLASKYGNGSYEDKFKKINLTSESLGLKRWSYSGAYNSGYSMGAGLEDKISGIFGGDAMNDLLSGLGDVTGSDGTGSKALKTTSNDDLLSDEDIQLLLDVATRDYKLSYQQVTPNITVTFGDINETVDVDDVLDRVADKLEEIYDGNLEVS